MPGSVHLADSGADVRCLDLDAYPATNRHPEARLRTLSMAADLCAEVVGEPGQLLEPGRQRIPWDRIAWVSMRDLAAGEQDTDGNNE